MRTLAILLVLIVTLTTGCLLPDEVGFTFWGSDGDITRPNAPPTTLPSDTGELGAAIHLTWYMDSVKKQMGAETRSAMIGMAIAVELAKRDGEKRAFELEQERIREIEELRQPIVVDPVVVVAGTHLHVGDAQGDKEKRKEGDEGLWIMTPWGRFSLGGTFLAGISALLFLWAKGKIFSKGEVEEVDA